MPVKKVYMLPTVEQAEKDTTNAINQIVLRLAKHLPMVGWEITDNRHEADVVAAHAGQTYGEEWCDVAHCHGLYPTAEFNDNNWHFAANKNVIQNLRHAKEITVPSGWVADLIRRDMNREPDIIPWALDRGAFRPPQKHRGYVLWNKTRSSGVCDPTPVEALARRNPDFHFVTTFGDDHIPNLEVIGRQPYKTMKGIVNEAMVYLATTKETFGIGTLEAMASGVPVLGYRWGALPSIIEHGVEGFMAEPGDLDGLQQGLKYVLEHRAVLGKNARARALEYDWDFVAERFAEVYNRVVNRDLPAHKVAVIIPCHNYEDYVDDAVRSVLHQNVNFDVELHIVFDRTTDNSEEVVQAVLGEVAHPHIKPLIHSTDFGGPARTRNWGIGQADAEYIVPLDADDMLGHLDYLQTLADYLDEHPDIALAFTGLQPINSKGQLLDFRASWPDGYDVELQAAGRNQIPTCNMFRKAAWARAGGYRHYLEPSEDAELWLRMGALGYRMAHAVRDRWFVYRMHDRSLTQKIREGRNAEPNWRVYHPWIQTGNRPFVADGKPPRESWPVRNYDQPLVSIVIPVGPYHTELVYDALDSVWGQTEWRWECIVVNDSGGPLDLSAYPWARYAGTEGEQGAGVARNLGVAATSAPLVTFLDADDMLYPQFLEKTLAAYRRTGRYIYSDSTSLTKDHRYEVHQTSDYEPGLVFRKHSPHLINILIERAWWERVNGFDEQMSTWEDVDFFMRLAVMGICGQRVPEPLLLYRYPTGRRREVGEDRKQVVLDFLNARYKAYIQQEETVCCGDNPKRVKTSVEQVDGDLVRIEYAGPPGRMTVIGPSSRKNYGRRANGEVFFVFASDARADPRKFRPIGDPMEVARETQMPDEPKLVPR